MEQTEIEFWEKAFLALLPVAMQATTWYVNGRRVTDGDGRVVLAASWADAAFDQRQARLSQVIDDSRTDAAHSHEKAE
ncbi:hypothetical protein [Burkholderia multivorans]|uniref:hypothetical protein n=1 Tax=Burkholderia multivorans TaxID=87883 RepID=UPI001588A5F0|nr:hypothetical protein [Burkholderia multivorans]MDR8920518.1 hypothetical protein [Burkholderia multivorans]MDR8921923.1 hypothetical protein [Burkholderia multivorans]MDR8965946.1 hypothetical protein [Burkholderia multivorans]MDR8988580.1 hypothetical protein [Burkholderia multivorans]MDR9019579.1 hypothetical protein [Burkholderia multivorans]